jgi:protein required for attachment to host cells
VSRHWVVVADHAQARIYEGSAGMALRELTRLDNAQAHQRAQDLGSDRPGRRIDSFGHRHALGGEEDPKRRAAADFAKSLADHLAAARRTEGFDALTLVMPPHFLGLLRKSLSADCARRVERVVRKDLMHCSPAQLRTELDAALSGG